MRTPLDEAHRIVDEIEKQMLPMPEKLQRLPRIFFDTMLAVDDLGNAAKEIERNIAASDAFAGHCEYLFAVFRSCAHAAAACRLSEERAWMAVMNAQRHAGVALAGLMSFAEANEIKKARARHAKGEQTKGNAAIRAHVLNAAAHSHGFTVSGAAKNVVGQLKAAHGGLGEAVIALGSTLTPEEENLERVFADYVKKDMERLELRSPGETVPQPLNRELFARWKKLYVSPADS